MPRREPRELVNTPKQIRNRLRRKGKKFEAELDLYQDEVYGKRIEEWDLEELSRGRPRDALGGFRGPAPKWITPLVVKEAKRRLLDHTLGSLAGHVELAVKTIGNLLASDEVDDFGRPVVDARTKLAAAQFVIENVIGKPKAILEIDGTDTVKQFLASALVLDDGTPAHPVIQGEVVEDDEEDEEDDDEPPSRSRTTRRPAVSDVPEPEVVARRPTRRRSTTPVQSG